MGPLGDASAAPSSSPGRTRTYNPSVNSRMLCRLSYRGRLRMGLYGSGGRASRFGGDGVQCLFEGLYLGLERLFLVVVGCLPHAALTSEDAESQPRFSHGGLGGVEHLPFGDERADPVHQRAGSAVREAGLK